MPKNIKDFYKYFLPKVDELMARHGFEYAPHLFNTEVHKRKKLEPDVIIYAKPMTNGQQTIYINYRDVYKDGEYSNLCLEWYLSDKEVERIYLHELDNIILTYGETEKKTINCRWGGGNIEYYLTQMWYHTGPSVSYKTETEIEALLAYWDQKLREVAWIDTYDDIDRFYELNTVTHAEKDAGKGMFTFNSFMPRLVILYLAGKTDLRERMESWLAADDAYIVNREYVRERYTRTLNHLENKQKEES